MFAFDNMILRSSPHVVKENRTACEVGHMKTFMKDFVFDIVRIFL